MDTSETPERVQYNRWNEDNINLNVAPPQSGLMGLYNSVCTGNRGIVLKVAGAVATLVFIYFIGYTTGYYVHRC